MRRTHVLCLALSTAILVQGCKEEGQSKSPQPAPSKVAEKAAALATDPATVLAVANGGLDVAIKLKQLFGSGDSGDREIRQRLRAIQQQNAQIIARLNQVLEILNNLGVIVSQSVRAELVEQQRAVVGSNLQLFYETYGAELDDTSARARSIAYQRYERDLLPALRPLIRQFAENTDHYGFGAFETVGQGMLAETWMARRIREPLAFRKQAGATYATYFTRVLDPQIANSVGGQLAAKSAQRNRLKAILDGADARVRGGFSITRRERTGTRPCRGGRITITHNITYTVQGDQAAGYRLVETARTGAREDNSQCTTGDGPTCPMCLDNALLPDPVDNGDMTPQGRVAYWNAVRKHHVEVAHEVTALEAFARTAQTYLEVAQQVARGG